MSQRAISRIVWVATVALFGIWMAVAKVPTHLGVKAPTWDKDGHEHLWRVWWRARDDIIERESSGFVVMYTVLILTFAALSVVALWIALVPNDPGELQSPPFPEQ